MIEIELMELMQQQHYSKRFSYWEIHNTILEKEIEYDVAEIIIEVAAAAITNAFPLLTTARKIANRIDTLIPLRDYDEATQLRYGCECINYMAQLNIVDVEKLIAIQDDEAKQQYYIVSTSQEFTEYAAAILPSKTMLSPINGAHIWEGPELHIGTHSVPIVKKAKRYNLLSQYAYEEMVGVYNSLNRLNRQGFIINRFTLSLTETRQGSTFPFIPTPITEDERKDALRGVNDVNRKARYLEEIRFKEMNRWLEDTGTGERVREQISRKKASEDSQDYYDTKVEPFIDTISAWSKRMDYEKISMLAWEWRDEIINYLFNMDTRGRIYAVQNYLTPLGSDFAKAMLLFDTPQQVSGYDLCIHIANCFGKDKLSFEERVEWVNENSEKLYLIGTDPISNYNLIEELELQKEKKTKWQGVAACGIYKDYIEFVQENSTEAGFTTLLPIGLDSTASGTQILSILGRDDKVAPYVNISESTTGSVGDFYTYLSKYLKPKLELYRDDHPNIAAILNEWETYSRKLSKRNSMTYVYSGTKYGFGEQHWQDRHDYGELGSNLTRADCRIIGNEMYDVCSDNIRGGAEIMEWLRQGVDYRNGGATISWTLPDGFKAFQVADKSKKEQLKVTIGDKMLQLVYYSFQDKIDKKAHKNAISPNYVHSLDAYLLREIVRSMPDEAPISTVHDQFSTSSYHIKELQDVAKLAYKKIGDREVAEEMCAEAFGVRRELPCVGTWSIDEIDDAEFIIC